MSSRTRFTSKKGIDISDADAAVGEVMQGKTFYSVAPPRKTGTMATVAIVAANDNYPQGYHVGNVGGLDAIDPDLAPGNIATGVTIFGKVGTAKPIHHSSLTDLSATTSSTAQGLHWEAAAVSAALSEGTIMTTTVNLVIPANVVGCYAGGFRDTGDKCKLRLYIDGVQMNESVILDGTFTQYIVVNNRDCAAGNRVVSLVQYNTDIAINRKVDFIGGLLGTVGKL